MKSCWYEHTIQNYIIWEAAIKTTEFLINNKGNLKLEEIKEGIQNMKKESKSTKKEWAYLKKNKIYLLTILILLY